VKRLLRTAPAQAAIAWIAAQYIRLVFATSRSTVVGGERLAAMLAGGKPIIGCFWHGRMLMIPKLWNAAAPMYLLISEHQDGRLISRTIAHFGVGTITGSSSRGGMQALRTMVRALGGGKCVAVTPDGPRGPRMRAALGIAMAAKLSGIPIVPASFSTTRAVTLSSWDRFLLALPFGRLTFIVGEPVDVPAGADDVAMEAARVAVEAQLNQLTQQADRLCGRKPVEPAAAPAGLATDPA
jgi:lysophospholipid acyltransferase (LPLAT)-like uncharacterized protein